MKSSLLLVVLLFVLPVVSQTAVAQPPNDSQITEARGKGVAFLKSKQLDEGHWEMPGHDVGVTALCALALVENGLSPYDPVIEKAHRYVKKSTKDLGSTYDIALAIVLLSRLDEHLNKSIIRDLGARLIAGQNTGGGWTYTCPAKVTSLTLSNPESRPKPAEGPGDNSCTQFAVLGLWTASRSGIDIDQPMAAVAHRFKHTQNADGGWPYTTAVANQGGTAVTNPSGTAMTFAGLFGLTVARANKLRKQIEERELAGEDKPKPGTSSGSKKGAAPASKKSEGDKKADAPAEAAAEKTDEASVLMKDPLFAKGLQQAGVFVQGGDQSRYFLWSTERLGVLLGLDKFGGVDWFAKGSESLIKTQKMDGSWPEEHNDKGLSQTSFAILFLRKANLGSDISRLLEGDPEKAFVISARADKPRFLTIEEALKAAMPGETIRVEGDGPFKLPHLIIDKTVTIEAGNGYLPTFVYDIGLDSRGIRSRPDKDPEARYLLKVAGTSVVTLEGLKFEFDPPELGATIPWCGLRISGGSVRMLNCSITEEGRKGSALIEMTEPSKLQMRNCLLAGGRAAVEVSAKGAQLVEADTCLLFSDNCVAVLKNAAAKEADTKLSIRNCTVQGTSAFHAPNVATTISIIAENNLFKTDWIGSTLLVADNSKQSREWSGLDNVFGSGKWLGTNSRAATTVTDAKSFAKFWGSDDKTSAAKSIVFEGKRQNKSSSHRMRATEFAVAAQSELGLSGNRTGMQFSIVGAGRAFSRYRESTLYTDWKRSLSAAP